MQARVPTIKLTYIFVTCGSKSVPVQMDAIAIMPINTSIGMIENK